MPFNIPLAGRIEPGGDPWQAAPAAERATFYRRAGEVAVRVLREQLLRGIGADGARMIPRQKPRRDGATGPVMDPHGRKSRTVRLMASKAWEKGVTVFWHAGIGKGQKLPWGKILEAHASGTVIGAYLRDVRMATRSVANVRAEMATWWNARLRTKGRARRRRPGGNGGATPAQAQPLAARPTPYAYPRAGRLYTQGARPRRRP